LGEIFGIAVTGPDSLSQLWALFTHLSKLHPPTLIVSLMVIAIIVAARLFAPKFPGALVAVTGTIFASYYLNFSGHGFHLIGQVEGGLPPFSLPSVSLADVEALLPVAGACFVMIITQSSATARAFGVRHQSIPDENRDLIGLGAANVVAGLSGTFVVNGSPTQTAMIESYGGRSQLSNLATAATVGVILILLTGPLKYLPLCVIGAIVFVVAVSMIDIKGLRDLWRCGRKEFWVALLSALSVVVLGVGYGIQIAIVVSLLDHVRRGYKPRTAVVVRDRDIHWRMEKVQPGIFVEPGVILYWFGTDLYYANAPHFCDEIRHLVSHSPGVRAMIIDCGPITSMDFTAGRALLELHADLEARGVTLALTRVTEGLSRDLNRQCLTCEFGDQNIFRSRKQSLAAYRDTLAPLSSSV
jgi:MFS superfamily sulfate permease-like transporter